MRGQCALKLSKAPRTGVHGSSPNSVWSHVPSRYRAIRKKKRSRVRPWRPMSGGEAKKEEGVFLVFHILSRAVPSCSASPIM